LIYAQQRWLDPGTGQFTSEDPIMDGLNWYAYAGGNPMGAVDPAGLDESRVGPDGNTYRADSSVFGGSGGNSSGPNNNPGSNTNKPNNPDRPKTEMQKRWAEQKEQREKNYQERLKNTIESKTESLIRAIKLGNDSYAAELAGEINNLSSGLNNNESSLGSSSLNYDVTDGFTQDKRNPKSVHTLLVLGKENFNAPESEKEFYERMAMLDERDGFDVIFHDNVADLKKSLSKYTNLTTLMLIGGHSDRYSSGLNYVLNLDPRNVLQPIDVKDLNFKQLTNVYLLGCYMGTQDNIIKWKSAFGGNPTIHGVAGYVNGSVKDNSDPWDLANFSFRLLLQGNTNYSDDFTDIFGDRARSL
jgi:hypothetical protein